MAGILVTATPFQLQVSFIHKPAGPESKCFLGLPQPEEQAAPFSYPQLLPGLLLRTSSLWALREREEGQHSRAPQATVLVQAAL